eukprot:SM000132S26889  [mRNA]  locus=s132:207855:211386:- [translate_table: standard]
MALWGPTDYAGEPARDPSLVVNDKAPFNAEPTPAALRASYITPVHYFYKRNHGPIPFCDVARYKLEVTGHMQNQLSLSLDEIKRLPKEEVMATLQCAGNRRTEMSKRKKVRGVGWGLATLGNAVWGGVKLWRILELAGIPRDTSCTADGARYVQFTSVDVCKEEKGGPYTASVPLAMATLQDMDVLLAYEMNGKGFFTQKDYKMFPPAVDWDNVDWDTRRPIMDFPVQCAICQPVDGDIVKADNEITVKGYAIAGGGRGIERVDVSVDGGATWQQARLLQQGAGLQIQGSGKPESFSPSATQKGDKWAWIFWELSTTVQGPCEVVAKAVDTSCNTQPKGWQEVWNLRGVLNNSWHRVRLGSAARL